MTPGEIAFCIGIGIGDLMIATEWAKYGLLELGIQRPINSRAFTGLIIGVGTVSIGGLANRFGGFEPSNTIGLALVGAALLWLLLFRYAILPAGLFDFNRARIRMNYWMLTGNYIPGQNLAEKAETLREFGLAQSAVKFFQRAIEAQLKGSRVWQISRTITLTDDMLAGWGNVYQVNCLACPFPLRIPLIRGRNMSGVCNMCGAVSTGRIEGGELHINTMLPKPIRMVSDQNRLNAVIGHEELALLYRMMNLFEEAQAELEKSWAVLESLLAKDPESREYRTLKSLIIFRQAEIAQVEGRIEQARAGYKESLALDEELGDRENMEAVRQLLAGI